jgi:sulfur-oxidizing protein SoxA
MRWSNTLRKFNALRHANRRQLLNIFAAMALFVTPMSSAQTTPEQDRQALIKALQARLPGTQPADWTLGGDTLAPSIGGNVQAIPFNADNATNSADILAIGKKLWERKFKDGKSMASCFPNGGKRAAVGYPQYDVKLKKIVTLEMAINLCLQQHNETEIEPTNTQMMGPLSAYARSLSEGLRIAIKVGTPTAKEKFDAGGALFARRIGQMNLACASCHVLQAGKIFGGGPNDPAGKNPGALSPAVGQATSWPRLEPGGVVRSLQRQYQHCMRKVGAEPFQLGSDELNSLEYYHSFLSNGLAIRVLGVQW